MYVNGDPSRFYCAGQDSNGSPNSRYEWWNVCCKWDGSSCIPRLELRRRRRRRPPNSPLPAGTFVDRAGLKAAVDDLTTAEETHGAISGWDTSRVDDMSELFQSKTTFNAQLNWDTSKVTNMVNTFLVAETFNQPLEWDTSEVTSMDGTFAQAGTSTSRSRGTRAR